LVCAEFVLEKWPTRERYQELKNQVGKNIFMTDPIADMLNRIKNAQAAEKETVSLAHSRIKYEIALILQKGGFIEDVERKGRKEKKSLKIALKPEKVITGIKKISKPGQRIYTKSKEIKVSKDGYGLIILSTPKGLMTSSEARRKKLGGEVICEIW
jgi:small subunit ribosomal protein S8